MGTRAVQVTLDVLFGMFTIWLLVAVEKPEMSNVEKEGISTPKMGSKEGQKKKHVAFFRRYKKFSFQISFSLFYNFGIVLGRRGGGKDIFA